MRPGLVLISLTVMAGACAPSVATPQPAPAPAPTCPQVVAAEPPADERLFLAFLDELVAGRELPSLKRLQREHPSSPLTLKATALAERPAGLEAKARAAAKEMQQQKQDRSVCQQASAQLLVERDRLKKDLDELKRLTIDAETRNK